MANYVCMVVKKQLEQFIEYHGILSRQQSGFLKKHSHETTVIYVMNVWNPDLKRAFETTDREIMEHDKLC